MCICKEGEIPAPSTRKQKELYFPHKESMGPMYSKGRNSVDPFVYISVRLPPWKKDLTSSQYFHLKNQKEKKKNPAETPRKTSYFSPKKDEEILEPDRLYKAKRNGES